MSLTRALAFRTVPGGRALRLEEEQPADGPHGGLPAPAAAVDHQRRVGASPRGVQVSRPSPFSPAAASRPHASTPSSESSACTATASWRATPCGTWWWCTCSPGSTSPPWPTCWSSTTAWRTRPSRCSTCCWPSARWPPSTGTLAPPPSGAEPALAF